MAKWRPPRVDPDGVQHKDVAHAAEYSIEQVLYRRQVGTGNITCRLHTSATPAKRIVQLTAEYDEGGIFTSRVVRCESETEEMLELQRLEKIIRKASTRPAFTQQQISRYFRDEDAQVQPNGFRGLARPR